MGGVSLWARHEMDLERLRQAIPGGPSGWAPERLVFRDWWHWRDHELGFAHGRLALTGQNGSGKSTLLSLCLPTLLDGETAGGRLDPALSRDRHLHWYLLGDPDADPEDPRAFAYTARTGYFALELRHGSTGRYLTLGMGVSAARNHPRLVREWWGFVVPDLRLGRDWDVRAEGAGNCLPPRELQKVLAPPAVVTEERAAYRREVNARLFGMEDDDYQALISMLEQARRPKLGEQAGPDHMCALLRDSLPGVPADRLARVADVVENIERYQRNLREAARRAEAVAEVDTRLRALAEVLAQDAARLYREAAGTLGSASRRLQDQRSGLAAAEEELALLARRSAERSTRLGEIEAALSAYRQRPDADLPRQLAEARERAASSSQHAARLGRLLAEREGDLREHDAALEREDRRFRGQRDRLAGHWRDLAEQAAGAAWGSAERALRAAADALAPLGVGSPAEEIAGIGPRPELAREARALAAAYRQAAERRRARDLAEEAVRARRQGLDALRAGEAEALDAEGRAEDGVAAARETLLGALEAWRASSPALALDAAALAPVALAAGSLEAVPEDGASGLLAPVRQAAGARRTELDSVRRRSLEEAGRASVLAQSLQAEIAEARRVGVLPPRSPLRREARAAAEGAPHPLFRWVRFREGVDEATAAAVEAAGLEAGLFDLLVAPGAGDAWLLAGGSPGAEDRTLLDVLEPEPSAPPAVAAALAAIGWGEGCGEAWIAPDGRWRHGKAGGQVAPWLHGAAGLVGEERRAAAGRARLEALQRAHDGAEGRRAEASARADQAERSAGALQDEVEAAAALPWQPLFSALADRAAAAARVAAARRRVEEARPALEAALQAHAAAHQEYEGALGLVPAARILDRDGMVDRAAGLEQLARALGEPQAEALLDAARAHRERQAARARDAEHVSAFRPQAAEAHDQAAAAAAQAAALERRLADPDVERMGREIADLEAERGALGRAAEDERDRREELAKKAAGHRTLVGELEPQERDLRLRAAARLDRLRQRLALHESLAAHAESLERGGPVPALPHVPRPVAPEDADALERAAQAAKSDLQSFVHRHMDALGDERPTPDPVWDTVSFHREREELSAAELGRRLAAEAERTRQLIEREQQELYERIIYHGILDELRQLISRARAFTRRTNERLRGLRLSGGQRLALRLSPCDPELVPGATVGRALEEMDQGTAWLSEERRESLLRRIREEVERVRSAAAAAGGPLGYYEAIRVGLDYRRWYEFRLMSEPEGAAQPVEVRSRGFGRWSTSAKAWALAVPVLAGVAARYAAAGKPDAPALVGLDEAFAGFDPNNQANYLRFLGDLNLSWILTCPEELPYGAGLSAAMAYRLTLEGNVHMALPVLWDGTAVRDALPDVSAGDEPPEAGPDRAPGADRNGAGGP